jgi:hypothetical protein
MESVVIERESIFTTRLCRTHAQALSLEDSAYFGKVKMWTECYLHSELICSCYTHHIVSALTPSGSDPEVERLIAIFLDCICTRITRPNVLKRRMNVNYIIINRSCLLACRLRLCVDWKGAAFGAAFDRMALARPFSRHRATITSNCPYPKQSPRPIFISYHRL